MQFSKIEARELHGLPAIASYNGANRMKPRAAPSKLNSAVPTKVSRSEAIVLQETPYAEAAQPTLKNVGRIALIHALALKSRVNPD
jgi:hypothetical protein